MVLFLNSAFRIPHSAFAHSAFAQSEITPPPSPSPTPARDAEWDAGVGLSAYNAEVKGGCWYPVWVEVRALRAPVAGTATIAQEYNSLRVEIPIAVAKGARKIYRSAYLIQAPAPPMSQAPMEVKLSAAPLGTESIPINLRFAQRGDRHVLALCEQPGAFNFLNRDAAPRTRSAAVVFGRQAVIYSRPDLLPDDPVPLQSLDAVIVDTPQVRRLTAAQWRALRAWVAQGGQLLLATGRQQPFIQESPLRNPFGVALRPPEPARWNDVLSGTVPLSRDLVTTPTADTFLVAWPEPPPGGWDDVRIGAPTRPFLAGMRFGRGWFHVCAASLDPPVVAAFGSLFDANDLLPAEQTPPSGPLDELLQWGERDLGLALQSGFAVTLAGVRWVLIYLLLYNLIAMPINWWLCRRLRRPGLFWPLLILCAGAFAWFGYKSGVERQQRNFQVNELTLISRAAAGVPARAISLTTLFTPHRINGDLPAAGPVYLNRLVLADKEELDPLTIGFDPVAGLRRAVVYPWSVLNLRAQFTIDDPGAIELDHPIRIQGLGIYDDTPLVITNRTKHRFDKWWLRRDNNFWPGPAPLDPGTSQTLTAIFPKLASSAPGLLWPCVQDSFHQQGTPNLGVGRPFRSGSSADRETVYFLGAAHGIASPFAVSFMSQKSSGCIFYEQPLPMRETQPSGPKPWAPGLWTARVVSVGGKPVDPQDEPLLSPGGATVCFPLNTVIVEFMPHLRRRRDQVPLDFEFSFTFDNYPDPNGIWRSRSDIYYKMETCPQEVFNFRTNAWESLRGFGWHQFTPFADYLHPLRSSVTLRLKAEPSLVLYSARRTQGGAFIRRLTGKELFEPVYGVQLPMDVNDMRRGPSAPTYRGNWQNAVPQKLPVAAQLLNLMLRIPDQSRPSQFITIPFGGAQP